MSGNQPGKMKGQAGGARPGAGRKPNAEKYRPNINRAEKKIIDKLPEIVDAMIALSLGVMVERDDEDDGPIVYKTKPDRQAGEYLINRIAGKPTERQEIDVSAEIQGSIKGYVGISPDDWDDPNLSPAT